MSIVYDYLKQIHEQKETKKVLPEAPPVPKSAGTSFWVKAAAGVVVVCSVVGVALYWFSRKAEKTTVKIYQTPENTQTAPFVAPDSGYILEGIIYNPSRPFAIINGKMLEAGGRVGEFEVVQITPDSVSLKSTRDNTSRTIRL